MATVEGTSHSVTLSLEAEAERLTYVVSDLRGRRQALSDEDTDRLLRADDALRERLATAGERFHQNGGHAVEPVRDAVEVLERDLDARCEAPVHGRAERTPLRAQVPPPRPTPGACPAGGEVGLADDSGAVPCLVDALPERRHDAGDLVAQRDGRPRGKLVVDDVEVRAADPRRRDLEDDATGSRGGLGPLGERDVPGPRRELRDAQHGQVDELVRA